MQLRIGERVHGLNQPESYAFQKLLERLSYDFSRVFHFATPSLRVPECDDPFIYNSSLNQSRQLVGRQVQMDLLREALDGEFMGWYNESCVKE